MGPGRVSARRPPARPQLSQRPWVEQPALGQVSLPGERARRAARCARDEHRSMYRHGCAARARAGRGTGMTRDTRAGARLMMRRDASGLTVAQGRVEGMGAEAVAAVRAWVDERRAHGSMSMGPSASGRWPPLRCVIWQQASSGPTPGPQTPTNDSTSPTPAAWPSSAMGAICTPPCPLRPPRTSSGLRPGIPT